MQIFKVTWRIGKGVGQTTNELFFKRRQDAEDHKLNLERAWALLNGTSDNFGVQITSVGILDLSEGAEVQP